MAQIPETIDTLLTQQGLGGYTQQAAPVKEALVKREQDMVEALLAAAVDQGIDPDDATRTFEGLGMHLPTAPAVQPGADDRVTEHTQALADQRREIDALKAFARANGFTG